MSDLFSYLFQQDFFYELLKMYAVITLIVIFFWKRGQYIGKKGYLQKIQYDINVYTEVHTKGKIVRQEVDEENHFFPHWMNYVLLALAYGLLGFILLAEPIFLYFEK